MKINESEKNLNNNPESVHTLHPYPCKFPGTTARELIRKYSRIEDMVCDPFVGSGTTLVEASLKGMSSIGVDINPIACLISKVKATPMTKKEISMVSDDHISELTKYLNNSYENDFRDVAIFDYPSINHWFQLNVIKELSTLKQFIYAVKNENIQSLYKAVLSSIIVRVSNQESDTRYAAIDKKIKDFDTYKIFLDKLSQFVKSIENFSSLVPNNKISVSVFADDTRTLRSIKTKTVDIIITSPPYANTYDYYLYHKHRKYWLDMDVKTVMENEIGSRREFSSLKKLPSKWIDDAKKTMAQMYRITKKGGRVFIIIGDSVIKRELINNGEIFVKLGKDLDFKHVETKTTPLNQHSSAFNPSFQAKEKNEHLIYFEK